MRIVIPVSLLLLTAAMPAWAQMSPNPLGMGGMGGSSTAPGGVPTHQPDKEQKVAPPSAVPGAKPRPDSVTPLKGGTNDLPPTEALFDAINRGDILSARDAINRGADLDSTNLLGLTPIELSVDLGRNDISFLLLSLRGATGSAQAAKQPAVDMPATPAPDRRGRRATATVTATRVPPPLRGAPPSTLHPPALFAGNGGAPIPGAGFLGFDPHQ